MLKLMKVFKKKKRKKAQNYSYSYFALVVRDNGVWGRISVKLPVARDEKGRMIFGQLASQL